MEALIETELSRRLEKVMTHFGLNDSKLAEIAGVSPTAIGNIMKGLTDNPKISLLRNISSKLKISMDWLALGEGEMLKNTTVKPIYQDSEVSFLKGRIIELENTVRYFTMGKFDGLLNLQNAFFATN